MRTSETYLESACNGDADLRREVESLLVSDQQARASWNLSPGGSCSSDGCPRPSFLGWAHSRPYQFFLPCRRYGRFTKPKIPASIAPSPSSTPLTDSVRAEAPLYAGGAGGLGPQSSQHHHHSRHWQKTASTSSSWVCGEQDARPGDSTPWAGEGGPEGRRPI